MPMFTIDELQASLINNENIISRKNASLEGEFVALTSISRGRGRGRNNSRGRGIISYRGGRDKIPANVTGRGENQNPSHPSGQRFDK